MHYNYFMAINTEIKINNKTFPARIHEGEKPQYVFVVHHGLLSNKTSFRYFEKWLGDRAILIGYDARVNGDNQLRASRMSSTYARDLRDVIKWAKQEYKDIPVVTLGSSWGANVVIDYAAKYGNQETFKNVAWSIPFNFMSGEEATEVRTESKKVEEPAIKQTNRFGYAWRFILMILFNINTKALAKVDLEKTANNRALARINRMNKPKKTPVKLFYAVGKSLLTVFKKLNKINKQDKHSFLYIQSKVDSYLRSKDLNKLKSIDNNGLDIVYMDKGKHAFQWETEDKLNEKVFQVVWDWLNKK